MLTLLIYCSVTMVSKTFSKTVSSTIFKINSEPIFYGLSYMFILINSTCQGQKIKSSIVLSYLLSVVVFIVLEDLLQST